MVRLLTFNWKAAAQDVFKLALKVETQEERQGSSRHDGSSFWFNLAADIEQGRYNRPQETQKLVLKYPFLKRWSR